MAALQAGCVKRIEVEPYEIVGSEETGFALHHAYGNQFIGMNIPWTVATDAALDFMDQYRLGECLRPDVLMAACVRRSLAS